MAEISYGRHSLPSFGNLRRSITCSYLLAFSMMSVDARASSAGDAPDLFSYSLEELLNVPVITATGEVQSLKQTPAAVTVISAEDLRAWSVGSIGEALSMAPGVYCTLDWLSYNCGLRGISGGNRGHSKVLKVLINGQRVAFRSDTNNYLGAELVPITMVERIEVLRGPASALYGADAFLGVVNIITKQSEEKLQVNTDVRAITMNEGIGHQASITLAGSHHTWAYNAGFSSTRLDRGGLPVPDDLPALSSIDPSLESNNDISQPMSFYADLSNERTSVFRENDKLKLTVDAWYSSLETDAQWQDFGYFSQSGRLGYKQHIALNNQFIRGRANYQYNAQLQFKLEAARAEGAPASNERLDVGAPSFIPQRVFSFDATDLVVEARWKPNEKHSLTLGYDSSKDEEQLFQAWRIERESGQRIMATPEAGMRTFKNNAAYFQYQGELLSKIDLTLNARHDNHNIYGDDDSFRGGVIYHVNDKLSFKAIVGNAYKAPAALQLYAQPLFSGEVEGNENLVPEKVETIEFMVNWTIDTHSKLDINIFNTTVNDRITVVGVKALNAGLVDSAGTELDYSWVNKTWSLRANVSWQQSDESIQNFIGNTFEVPSALYPELMSGVFVSKKMTSQSQLVSSIRYVSPRRASRSNILLNGNQAYQLQSYTQLDLGYHYQVKEHLRVFAKLNNILGAQYYDPGFNGIDVSGMPRTIILGINASF